MSKPVLFVTARSGGRPEKATVERVLSRILSGESLVMEPLVAAAVVNECLEKKAAITIRCGDDGLVRLTRA